MKKVQYKMGGHEGTFWLSWEWYTLITVESCGLENVRRGSTIKCYPVIVALGAPFCSGNGKEDTHAPFGCLRWLRYMWTWKVCKFCTDTYSDIALACLLAPRLSIVFYHKPRDMFWGVFWRPWHVSCREVWREFWHIFWTFWHVLLLCFLHQTGMTCALACVIRSSFGSDICSDTGGEHTQ